MLVRDVRGKRIGFQNIWKNGEQVVILHENSVNRTSIE